MKYTRSDAVALLPYVLLIALMLLLDALDLAIIFGIILMVIIIEDNT